MKIQHILNTKGRQVVTINPYQSLREGLSLLVGHNIGALVVTNEDDHPVGLLSERDIIHAAERHPSIFSMTVSDLMTREMIVGDPDTDVEAIAHTMTEKRTRHVLAMDQGRLLGIISIGDVVKAQRDAYEGTIYTLETMIMDGPLDVASA